MSTITKEEILNKTKELAGLLAEQEEIILYKKAEQQVAKHKRIQELIANIKRKQQELVNAKHYKKKNYVKQLEEELDQLNKELHDIPLIDQYQQSQAEINNYLQSLLNIIKLEISKKIPIDNE